MTEISKPDELLALAGTFIEWAAIVSRAEETALLPELHCSTGSDVSVFRYDLIETLIYLSKNILDAARNGFTILIVGI